MDGPINYLPEEMLENIKLFIGDKSLTQLESTCTKYYAALRERRVERCSSDVHDAIDICCEEVLAMCPALQAEGRSAYGIEGDGKWISRTDLKCTKTGVHHYVRCEYVRFQRDVDTLEAFVDNVSVGWRML